MANKKRLIDANALLERISDLDVEGGHWLYRKCCDYMLHVFVPELVIAQPTVDAVKHGVWEQVCDPHWMPKVPTISRCSACGQKYQLANIGYNYCPNCGAMMDLPNITGQTMDALLKIGRKAHGGTDSEDA